jgi:hypothetical protein
MHEYKYFAEGDDGNFVIEVAAWAGVDAPALGVDGSDFYEDLFKALWDARHFHVDSNSYDGGPGSSGVYYRGYGTDEDAARREVRGIAAQLLCRDRERLSADYRSYRRSVSESALIDLEAELEQRMAAVQACVEYDALVAAWAMIRKSLIYSPYSEHVEQSIDRVHFDAEAWTEDDLRVALIAEARDGDAIVRAILRRGQRIGQSTMYKENARFEVGQFRCRGIGAGSLAQQALLVACLFELDPGCDPCYVSPPLRSEVESVLRTLTSIEAVRENARAAISAGG